jgi:hypothetical protein
MSVNLNEFTSEQLKFAIDLFTEKQNDFNYSLKLLEEKFEGGEIKSQLHAQIDKELDTAILFRIQFENALNEVKRRELMIAS